MEGIVTAPVGSGEIAGDELPLYISAVSPLMLYVHV